ncbi:MAG: hypothetical protein HY881_08785 [Deltaproteobacteria bacterium]|nr:hypothetical protein [Deltaproteobacteria bacterium]
MKTNVNPIWFLYSNRHRKPGSLSASFSGNKVSYAGRIAMISHQLIFESTANDVFWILYSNTQGKKRLGRISEDYSQ